MAAQLLERLPANGADLGSAVWTVRDDGWLDDLDVGHSAGHWCATGLTPRTHIARY